MTNQAVIGCGFGDEGKGKVVSYLCPQFSNPLVVRYSGGQQAGHHVVLDDKTSHVFSNFGSGTLQGVPTYWSPYCTIDPVGIINELEILIKKVKKAPELLINLKCPVTTPYEKLINRRNDVINGHGSVGVGVGQTFQREENFHSILFEDLFFPSVLNIKLELLRAKYEINQYYIEQFDMIKFLKAVEEITNCPGIVPVNSSISLPTGYSNYIFEGSQGLLLDQHFGFFPHVTRSNTGTKNIIELTLTKNVELFLVTRAYQTRHGNGPMTNEKLDWRAPVNSYEQNKSDGFQGEFRSSILDLDLLKYAIQKDEIINNRLSLVNLVITCLDTMSDFPFTYKGKIYQCKNSEEFCKSICEILNIKYCYASYSPLPKLTKILPEDF